MVAGTAGDDGAGDEDDARGTPGRMANRSSNDWRRHVQYLARIVSTLVAN